MNDCNVVVNEIIIELVLYVLFRKKQTVAFLTARNTIVFYVLQLCILFAKERSTTMKALTK